MSRLLVLPVHGMIYRNAKYDFKIVHPPCVELFWRILKLNFTLNHSSWRTSTRRFLQWIMENAEKTSIWWRHHGLQHCRWWPGVTVNQTMNSHLWWNIAVSVPKGLNLYKLQPTYELSLLVWNQNFPEGLNQYHGCWCTGSLHRPNNISHGVAYHYKAVIMVSIASQITSLTIVYSAVYSGADQRKNQSSASLAFVRGIHHSPVNSPHKWPVTRKMFPFDDVIMVW